MRGSRIRSLFSNPLIPALLTLIGSLLLLAFLWREELHRRGMMGLVDGIFLPLSAPYIGAVLILAGIFLATIKIPKLRMRKVILAVMISGYLVATFGLLATVAFYYHSFVSAVDLFGGLDPSASERYIMMGLGIFFSGFAGVIWNLMLRHTAPD